jgi:hypothetical protein
MLGLLAQIARGAGIGATSAAGTSAGSLPASGWHSQKCGCRSALAKDHATFAAATRSNWITITSGAA